MNSKSDKKILYSILIPAYNAQDTIEKCIESCLPISSIAELIVVDDGSTDKTCEIVKKYTESNQQIRLVNCAHRGQGSTRMRAITEARGKYVLFVDADDYLVEDYHRYLSNDITINEPDIIVFKFFYWGDIEEDWIEYTDIDCIKDKKTLFVYGTSYFWNKLIKKNLLEDLVIDNIYGEDDAVILPMLLECGKFQVLDKALYYHTTNEENLSSDTNNVLKVTKSYETAICRIKKSPFYSENRHAIYRLFFDRRRLFLDLLKYRFTDNELVQLKDSFDDLYKRELPELNKVLSWNLCFSGMPANKLMWTFPWHCRLCEIDVDYLISKIENQNIKNVYAVICLSRELLQIKLDMIDEDSAYIRFMGNFDYLVSLLAKTSGKGIMLVDMDREGEKSTFSNRVIKTIKEKYGNWIAITAPVDLPEFTDELLASLVDADGVPTPQNVITFRHVFDFRTFARNYTEGILRTWKRPIDSIAKKSDGSCTVSVAIYGVVDEIVNKFLSEVGESECIRVSVIYDIKKAGSQIGEYTVCQPVFDTIEWDYIIVIPFYIFDGIFFQLFDKGVPVEKIISFEDIAL